MLEGIDAAERSKYTTNLSINASSIVREQPRRHPRPLSITVRTTLGLLRLLCNPHPSTGPQSTGTCFQHLHRIIQRPDPSASFDPHLPHLSLRIPDRELLTTRHHKSHILHTRPGSVEPRRRLDKIEVRRSSQHAPRDDLPSVQLRRLEDEFQQDRVWSLGS